MNTTTSQTESRRIDVAGDCAVSVELSVADTVRCLDGQIWLTQEGDWRDYCLVAGVSFCADRQGRAVLSAIGGSSAVVVERYAGSAARGVVPGTVKVESIEALTQRARRARSEWIATVLAEAAAWCRARMRAAKRIFRTRRASRRLARG